jgi:hypothetical protein
MVAVGGARAQASVQTPQRRVGRPAEARNPPALGDMGGQEGADQGGGEEVATVGSVVRHFTMVAERARGERREPGRGAVSYFSCGGRQWRRWSSAADEDVRERRHRRARAWRRGLRRVDCRASPLAHPRLEVYHPRESSGREVEGKRRDEGEPGDLALDRGCPADGRSSDTADSKN